MSDLRQKIFIQISTVVILCLVLCPMACSSLGLFKGDDGKIHTQAGDTVMVVGKTMQEAGSFVPGYGTLFSLIGGFVVMAGGLVTSIRKAMSNGTMLDTVVSGIEQANPSANTAEIKKVIANVAVQKGVQGQLRNRVAKVTGDPRTGSV